MNQTTFTSLKIAVIILLLAVARAQLADAQNLLANGDFSSTNSGFGTSYTFISSGQSTINGSYGIRTNSQDFNPGYTIFGDHTTGNGLMLLVDGATSAGVTCWQESVSVATNRNYSFSGWATSSDGTSPAMLKMRVNGTQLGSDLTLGTDAGVWHPFAFVWNSGNATSAAISIVDDNTASLGNDFALDDLFFGTNSPVTTTILPAVQIDWLSVSNATYQVQYADAADTNVWFNLGGTVLGNGATNTFSDPTQGHSQRFYRVLTLH